MAKLFTPLKIKQVEFKNRITVSPMCQYSANDGFANDWHMVHLGSRAVGGAGLIIFEASAVHPSGRISPQDLGIWSDEHISPLFKITQFISQQGSVPGIQLAHAGRKASKSSPWQGDIQLSPEQEGWQTVAPSALAFAENDNIPRALTKDEIFSLIEDFKAATSRAVKAGFKVLEIHAAHGYLIHEFLSPLTNKRTDNYGGSFENRIRLLMEILKKVQEEWPIENPLFVRISATDWKDGGWTLEDSILLSKKLKKAGVDLVDCSSGGIEPHIVIPAGPSYQVKFAERIRHEAAIKTGAVGVITTAQAAEEILQAEQADLILLGRELLRDPYFPLKAAQALGTHITWPLQYERAKR